MVWIIAVVLLVGSVVFALVTAREVGDLNGVDPEAKVPVLKDERYYATVLGLQGSVTISDIRNAYRELSNSGGSLAGQSPSVRCGSHGVGQTKDLDEAYSYFTKKYGIDDTRAVEPASPLFRCNWSSSDDLEESDLAQRDNGRETEIFGLPEPHDREGLDFDAFMSRVELLEKILGQYLEIDKRISSCGLAPFDFAATAESLADLYLLACPIGLDLMAHSEQRDGNAHIRIAVIYVDKLLSCIETLNQIASNLARKAAGGKYGPFAYWKDTRRLAKYDKERIQVGYALDLIRDEVW